MRSIAVINQKGGCGKTITAINLSAFLAREQRKVLLIDMDPQGHATLGLQTDSTRPARTVSDVLLRGMHGGPGLQDVVRPVLTNLDLVPADILLSAVPERLSGVFGRETMLAEALAEVGSGYHYAIIDCPPNVGLLTFNALMASSEAIIPMDPSFFSLHGIAMLLETLQVLSRDTGHVIAHQALVTLFSGRSEFMNEVVGNIRKHMGDRTFRTVIRFSVKLAEAASHGVPISEYCKRSAGFEDYQALAREVMQPDSEMRAIESQRQSRSEEAEMERVLDEFRAPSAPIPTRRGVIFTLRAPEAHSVQVAGDFNHWEPAGNEMQFRGGVWQKVLPLAPGRYRYRYVVDGRWQPDPMNSYSEPSSYGDYDSVIVLDENQIGK
jgi:chromosome partitioning protein